MPLPPSIRHHFNRLRGNYPLIALLLAVLLLLWLATGNFYGAKTDVPAPEQAQVAEDAAVRVETLRLQAQAHTPVRIVQGQLEPLRAVDIRSQTSGHLRNRAVEWGSRVAAGDLLFHLDPETRAADLERAESELALREAELKAGEALFKKDLLSQTEYLRLKATASAARATRELNALHLAYTEIRAPFAGVVDRLPIEEGDFVQVGDTLATLVEVSELRLTGYIPQQQVYALSTGLAVEASLLDGTVLDGTLTFVASLAESSTRSFRVEARIINPDMRRIAGSSATLTIRLPERPAHRISPALLVLGEEGRLAVKAVDEARRVVELPLTILSFDTDGVWVEGLPTEVEIITLGAGFVREGDVVNAVSAG
jgi:multidrug efflux system membrane fusion protein